MRKVISAAIRDKFVNLIRNNKIPQVQNSSPLSQCIVFNICRLLSNSLEHTSVFIIRNKIGTMLIQSHNLKHRILVKEFPFLGPRGYPLKCLTL